MVKTLPLKEALSRLELPAMERNLFSSPRWFEVIYKTYGTRFEVKYIEKDGRVESYIIYSVIHNFLEWKICLCSYCDYSDGLVQSVEDWKKFFESLRHDYPKYRIAVRNLRDSFAFDSGLFKMLSREHFHILDLQPSLDEIWRKAHDSHKAAVNQAVKKGVTVQECRKAELRKFYRLHLGIRKNKYRIFPQPYRFFENIWDEYMQRGQGFLLGAYSPEGEFIGGNIYLICGDTLYYKFNTSSRAALEFRPNNLLFWEGIKRGKARNLKALDLGSSGYEQTGLIRFKEHAGAVAGEIRHLDFHPPDYRFSQKRILKAYTKLFTKSWIPDRMVEWGSRFIYPFLG
ncbi:MAG: GNAT family N-acetyltransferase [Candidatus Omnitrophota bacterium]